MLHCDAARQAAQLNSSSWRHHTTVTSVQSRYRTRVFCYDGGRHAPQPYCGKQWRAFFEADPLRPHLSGSTAVAQEIVFEAPSLRRAEYAAQLLLAADALCTGALSWFGDSLRVMREEEPEDPAERDAHREFLESTQGVVSNLSRATLVAARASHRRKHQYALFKMQLSYTLCSLHPMDLDPSHWRPGPAVSASPPDHVACAYAIQAAYSAIEELGLEVRASKEVPSMLNGKWNPPVVGDLRARLRRVNVDLGERVVWHRRHTPTLVERRLPTISAGKTPWARGMVRDVEVKIEDAINHASRLRSKVAAHRLPSIAKSLTLYDASNVQFVARRLLLEALGCWRRLSADA